MEQNECSLDACQNNFKKSIISVIPEVNFRQKLNRLPVKQPNTYLKNSNYSYFVVMAALMRSNASFSSGISELHGITSFSVYLGKLRRTFLYIATAVVQSYAPRAFHKDETCNLSACNDLQRMQYLGAKRRL